jgi:ubiquinone/menaquinone biosynthesis C-methylase UbiE
MPKPPFKRPFDRKPGPARPPRGRAARPLPPPAAQTSWDHVAEWYDKLVGDDGSDYHRNVVLPTALRLLAIQRGERVLDLACGQGVFSRLLQENGAGFVLGVDASSRLIAAARSRGGHRDRLRFEVGDACDLGTFADGSFDAAACLMAVQDIDDIAAAFGQMARALRVGGRAVIVMMHPCFRVPRQSSWEWDEVKKTQYRRLDRYAVPMEIPIATHPGSDPGQHTRYFHRPLAEYINALGSSGLAVTACEEPLTHRTTAPGARSRGENRSRQEFPVFLALRAVRLA